MSANMSPLWALSKSAAGNTPMARFMSWCAARSGRTFDRYDDFHEWSVDSREEFWTMVWGYCDMKGDKGDVALRDDGDMIDAQFFPEAQLNFAENLLVKEGEEDAIVFLAEDRAKSRWSWNRLRATVSRLQQALRARGIGEGDRVAAMMPNMPETVALMLAATSIGAIWSSCSPDFGVQGVVDRFSQIEPKLFIVCDGYWYNGKKQDVAHKARAIAERLNATVLVVPYIGDAREVAASMSSASVLDDFIAPYNAKPIEFARLPFSHPAYILFSSGTTGVPKCIVHSAGGTLLQHMKEHRLHCGIEETDRVFYFTTCGWMMWNWLVSALASRATLCLYDGSPFYPDANVLFDYAQAESVSVFGTSAKFIDTIRKNGLEPGRTHDLSALRLIASTGSPLSPESFGYVYESVKDDVHLASICGGTDIVSCFILANPLKPVWPGEIQSAGLGMAVEIWGEDGKPAQSGKGELVCTKAFPSMPVVFWNDPDRTKYKAAYFARFRNVWRQGDLTELTENGGFMVHGRSDATLNPGGVRIGTAEIYNQVEQLDEVTEAICVGQEWDNDVRVILFVRLADGLTLDAALEKKVKAKIRSGASPRHVPAKVIQIDDIPRTKSGKISELTVREAIHGRPIRNIEALANSDALRHYESLPQLQS